MEFIKGKNKTQEASKDSLMYKDMDSNIAKIKSELGNCSDLSINIFRAEKHYGLKYASIYIDNMVDKNSINSLSAEITEMFKAREKIELSKTAGYFDILAMYLSGCREHEEGYDFEILCKEVLSGKTILLVDGYSKFLSIDTFLVEGRVVGEPTTQNVIRGPKEGFTEKINVNISLIRKRIRSKALRVDNLEIGSITRTKVTLMYIDKISKTEIVNEIKRRLSKIEIDGILDSGYIEELIKDDRYSIFPEFLNSEKPDSVTAGLLEGKVAILVDGTSYVLTAPALFVEFLQASEDYYHEFIISTIVRLIRYIALFLAIFVPSIYIALVTFHQEMIPTPLLISICAQREAVAFPALIEAVLMEGTFEILREAGVRMPRVIGPAISIVGALVLGQAAVEAGIVSSVMVIIVSITAISSFAITNYALSNAVRVLRFIFMLLAGIYGLYGVFMGFLVLLLHLCKLKSIGIPYMLPIAPKAKHGTKDSIIRYPLWKNKYKPQGISASNSPRVNEENPVTPKEKRNPEFR